MSFTHSIIGTVTYRLAATAPPIPQHHPTPTSRGTGKFTHSPHSCMQKQPQNWKEKQPTATDTMYASGVPIRAP